MLLQRYKLRLGDGTVLGVDHEALSTWGVDGKAMVQAAATDQWYPLREFLARERAAARRAAGTRSRDSLPPGSAPPLPLVYPKPLPAGDLKPLPYVYPKPPQDEARRPPAAPSPWEPVEPRSVDEPTDVQALAEETTARPGEPPEPFATPQLDEPAVATLEVRDEQAKIPDLSSLQVLAEQPTVPPSVSSLRDLAEPAVPTEPVEANVLEALLRDTGEGYLEESLIPDDGFPPIPPPLDTEGEVTDDPALFAPPDPLELPSPGELVGVRVPEDEPFVPDARAASSEPPADEEIPMVWLETRDDEAAVHAAADYSRGAPAKAPSPIARPSLQALADDPAAGPASITRQTWKPDDELPIIPLKPLTDATPTPAGLGVYEGVGGEVYDETRPRSELEEKLVDLAARAISAYDALLTGWIERLGGRLSSTSPGRPAPARAVEPAWIASPRTVEPARIASPGPHPSVALTPEARVPAKPLEHDAPPAAPGHRNLYRRASAWLDDLTEGVARLARQDRALPPVPPSLPAVSKALSVASPAPLKPPPPVSELPVLRFADIHEEKEEGDVYAGESLPNTAWHWTKRVAVTSGLVAGVLVVALNWEAWGPKAEQLSRAAFTEMDQFEKSRDKAQRQRRALQEATEQLPHLAEQTIQLILATRPTEVLDPPEVFRLASDAADRGLSTLTAGEAQELNDLRGELMSALRPSERERVRDYDETRARRLVFPFESRDVVEVFARGGNALPSERRERLHELLGKAVAAGLVPPREAASRSAARR